MNKQAIQKAFAAAEKEQQEKEIDRIKKIVQSHLEKIESKKEARQKLSDDIRHLEKDLDDLKSGRLDLMHERHEKDDHAREVRIIIVQKVEKEYVPYYPWRSPWVVTWNYSPSFTAYTNSIDATTVPVGYIGTALSSAQTTSTADAAFTTTGVNCSNFAKGTYEIGNHIINL